VPNKHSIKPGEHIGFSTVIREGKGPPTKRAPNGPRVAFMKCDCGTEFSVHVSNLMSGLQTSCGCMAGSNALLARRILRNAPEEFTKNKHTSFAALQYVYYLERIVSEIKGEKQDDI
jgi:hypothetical protein